MELTKDLADAITPEVLRGMSHAELFALADAVAGITGEPIVKESDRERAIEAEMAKEWDEDYTEDLAAMSVVALAGLPLGEITLEEFEVAMDQVGRGLDQRDTSRALQVAAVGLGAASLLSRRTMATGLEERHGVKISGSLSMTDRGAVAALSRQQLWWIGAYWSDHLSKTITATVSKAMLEQGMGRVEAGRIMRGVINGTYPAVKVPETFPGTKTQYFEMLSGTVRNRASNISALNAIRDGGFTLYRIVAVMDERTSEQCREMNGRVFRVEDGLRQTEQVMAAETPDDYKEAAGWRRPEEIAKIAGTGSPAQQSSNLADAGLAMPPYHARCRTVILEEGRE